MPCLSWKCLPQQQGEQCHHEDNGADDVEDDDEGKVGQRRERQINIARGTTDPGYCQCIVNTVLS